MIRTSSALLNFDRLDQSLSNCKMGQSCVRETGPGTNLITPGYPLYLVSCMPELGLSLLIECINIGCGSRDECSAGTGRLGKSKLFFKLPF